MILLVAAGLRAPLAPGASPPMGCVLDKVSTYPWQSVKTENLSIVTFLIKMNLFTFVCEMSVLSDGDTRCSHFQCPYLVK